MYDFASKKYWFFGLSATLLVAGLVFFAMGGLKLGIEFEGGSSFRMNFEEDIGQTALENTLASLGFDRASVQRLEEHEEYWVRTETLSGEEESALKDGLEQELGAFTVEESGIVTPSIARETLRNAAIAVVGAAIVILFFITWAFRKMPSPVRYGTCGIAALIHDVALTIGLFSILGFALNWEISPMFITAMLAVIGYSINDTIVVFDRIRENLGRKRLSDFKSVVNSSLTETLTRSLNTSITTLLVILALYLFVGDNIRNFVVALLIGVVAGTYSSIFIASQLLIIWETGEWKKYVPDLPGLQRLKA
ncbi:MAG: protein translocase subunit SecF [Chloroflexota bacterium]|nr:protein translocase subunit SecF [Chloroflexota bacterium]